MNKQALIDRVINEMREDFNRGDLTAVEELLGFIPTQYLNGYISDTVNHAPTAAPALTLPEDAELEWVLSTAHTSEYDDRILTGLTGVGDVTWVFECEGGWKVSITDIKRGSVDLGEFSAAFGAIVGIAMSNGVAAVRFDKDGPIADCLKKFDW